MRCECGQRKVDGKCPTCDVVLKQPRWRATRLQVQLRQREMAAKHMGIGLKAANEGFKRFCDERHIEPRRFTPVRKGRGR